MDDEARVEEGLVRLQVAMLAKTIPRYKAFPTGMICFLVYIGAISVFGLNLDQSRSKKSPNKKE
jgi:hypothetical protein